MVERALSLESEVLGLNSVFTTSQLVVLGVHSCLLFSLLTLRYTWHYPDVTDEEIRLRKHWSAEQ